MKSSGILSGSTGTRPVRLRGFSVALVLVLLSTCACTDCIDRRNVSAEAGQTAVLPCQCPSKRPLFLVWQKAVDGKQLVVKNYIEDDPEDHSAVEYRERSDLRLSGDCALLLHHVNPSDEGQYDCYYQREPLRCDSIYLEVKEKAPRSDGNVQSAVTVASSSVCGVLAVLIAAAAVYM